MDEHIYKRALGCTKVSQWAGGLQIIAGQTYPVVRLEATANTARKVRVTGASGLVMR